MDTKVLTRKTSQTIFKKFCAVVATVTLALTQPMPINAALFQETDSLFGSRRATNTLSVSSSATLDDNGSSLSSGLASGSNNGLFPDVNTLSAPTDTANKTLSALADDTANDSTPLNQIATPDIMVGTQRKSSELFVETQSDPTDPILLAANGGSSFTSSATVASIAKDSPVSLEQLGTNNETFKVSYDLTNPDTWAGATINFQGSEDLSGIDEFVFNVKADIGCSPGQPCMRVEFVNNSFDWDVVKQYENDRVTYNIQYEDLVPGVYNPVTIDRAQLAIGGFDFTNIDRINFIVLSDMTLGQAVGSFEVQTEGVKEIRESTPITAVDGTVDVPRRVDRFAPALGEYASQKQLLEGGQPVIDQETDKPVMVDNAEIEVIETDVNAFTLKYNGIYDEDQPKKFIFAGVAMNYVLPFQDFEDERNRDENLDGIVDEREINPDTDLINFFEAFPQGLVLGLETADEYSRPGHEFYVEIKDAYGLSDKVALGDYISRQGGMTYLTLPSDYFESINLEAIQQIGFGFEGAGEKEVKVRIGGYESTPVFDTPNATENDLTTFPLVEGTVDGDDVRFRAPVSDFSSREFVLDDDKHKIVDPEDVSDTGFRTVANATATADQISRTEIQLRYTGEDKDAFGGMFVQYDADAKDVAEQPDPFDFTNVEVFPNGMVIGLRAPDENGDGVPDTDSVILEFTDDDDSPWALKSKVKITGLTLDTQYYRITQNDLDSDMNFDRIQTVALVFDRKISAEEEMPVEGGEPGDTTTIWKAGVDVIAKGFDYSPDMTALASDHPLASADKVSTLALVEGTNALGDSVRSRPAISPFQSTEFILDEGVRIIDNTDPTGFLTRKTAEAQAPQSSNSNFKVIYHSDNEDGFGGMFVNYDVDGDPDTGTNPRAFVDSFGSDGIVIGVSSPDPGVTEVKLELTDAAGFKSSVMITGLSSKVQYYQITADDFDRLNAEGFNEVVGDNNGLNMELIETISMVFDKKSAFAHEVDVEGEPGVKQTVWDATVDMVLKGLDYTPQWGPELDQNQAILDFNQQTLAMVEGKVDNWVDGVNRLKDVRFRPTVSPFQSTNFVLVDPKGPNDPSNWKEDPSDPTGYETVKTAFATAPTSSNSAFQITYQSDNRDGFGGMFINYDVDGDPDTGYDLNGNPSGTNPISFVQQYGDDGLVIGVKSTTPGVDEITLELTDVTGYKSSVVLTGLTSDVQYYRITENQLDHLNSQGFNEAVGDNNGLRLDQIKTIGMVFDKDSAVTSEVEVEGQPGVTKTVWDASVDVLWRGIEHTPSLTAQLGLGENDVSQLELVTGNVIVLDNDTGEIVRTDPDDDLSPPVRRKIRYQPGVSQFSSTKFVLRDPAGPNDSSNWILDSEDPTGYLTEESATSTVGTPTKSEFNIIYNSQNADGFGGMFLNYNAESPDEDPEANIPISFVQKYGAGGLVIGVKSPTPGVEEVTLELTDATGFKSSIILSGLTSAYQYYQINADDFDRLNSVGVNATLGDRYGIDLENITTISMVVDKDNAAQTGTLEEPVWNAQVDVQLKGFDWTPDLGASTTATTFSSMPFLTDNDGFRAGRPFITGYDDDGLTGLDTQSIVWQRSPSVTDVYYNGTKRDSFGGVFVDYDLLPDDGFVNTFDLTDTDLFPNGFSVGLSSVLQQIVGVGDYEAINSLILGVEDIDGDQDQIRLTGLNDQLQHYTINPKGVGDPERLWWDEIDFTKIRTISLTVESKPTNQLGQGTGLRTFHISWGNFDYTATPDDNPFA